MRLSRYCCLMFAALGIFPSLALLAERLSTPDLLRRLRGPEASERASAARSLSRSSPTQELVSALIEALQDEDAKVRRAACYGIRDFGADAEAGVRPLGRLLQDPETDVRSCAAGAMGSMGPAAAAMVPDLSRLLNDPETSVRQRAAESLGRIGPAAAEAKQLLLILSSDADPGVRAAALSALGGFGRDSQDVLPVLVEALRDEHKDVRRGAVGGLHALGAAAQPAIPALIEVLKDPEWTVASAVVSALFQIGPEHATAAIPTLGAIINDPNGHFGTRSGACDLLAAMGEPAKAAIPNLALALKANHDWVRRAAGRALATIDPRPDITPEQVKQAIAQVEVSFSRTRIDQSPVPGGEQEVKGLIAELSSEQVSVRREAARSLRKMGLPASAAVSALAQALGDEDATVRRAATDALGRMGEAAVPALVEALTVPDEEVRFAATSLGRSSRRLQAVKC